MAVDILFQSAEAFGNFGTNLGPPIGRSMRNLVLRDDRHLLAQVVGDLFGDGGLQRVQPSRKPKSSNREHRVLIWRGTPPVCR